MRRVTMKRFGRIVARVMESLPDEFAPHLDNLVVDVLREADEVMLARAGLTDEEIADGETIYGLFDPLDVSTEGLDVTDQPHRLLIFKRPLEEDFPEPREFVMEIRKTVIHELAHHFGYTDRDLETFDDNPDPFGDGWVEELVKELEGGG